MFHQRIWSLLWQDGVLHVALMKQGKPYAGVRLTSETLTRVLLKALRQVEIMYVELLRVQEQFHVGGQIL
jgi:hypothetical protein